MKAMCVPRRSSFSWHGSLHSLPVLAVSLLLLLLLLAFPKALHAQTNVWLPSVGDLQIVTGTSVAAGVNFTCAITLEGGVVCWGDNEDGQLGTGTFSAQNYPVPVVGLASGVTQLVAGDLHVCALTTSGGVKCWGYGYDGQLGDGLGRPTPAPVNVSGLTSGVVSIAAGGYHTCAVTTAGAVLCWGANWDGQIGDGTTTERNTPVVVSGASSGFVSVTAGDSHTCAVRTNGGMACWGYNGPGQLGDGTNQARLTPVSVNGLGGAVQQASAGGYFTCAVLASGGVQCWGSGWAGQLGVNSTASHTLPVDVPVPGAQVTALEAGYAHACAIKTDGSLYCWGYNSNSQIGDGRLVNQLMPYKVTALKEAAVTVSAGAYHTCVVTEGHRVLCWGDNRYAHSTHDLPTHEPAPVAAVGAGSGVQSIATSDNHNCLLTSAGGVKCWGLNAEGQLGNWSTLAMAAPFDVYGLSSGVQKVAVGSGMSCALMANGTVKCWGAYGYTATGIGEDLLYPVDVAVLGNNIVDIALGDWHGCALTTAGKVRCWGANNYGQLGDGANDFQWYPVEVKDLSQVTSIAANSYRTCAVQQNGGVKCWGWNLNGELGDGTEVSRNRPVAVNGLASGVRKVVMGGYHSCAIMQSTALKCWGGNWRSQLGIGNNSYVTTVVDVVGMQSGVESAALGDFHSCAVQWGATKCWGENYIGQVGDGTRTERSSPVPVQKLDAGVVGLSAGYAHSCAIRSTGGVVCWGDNSSGLLGNGKTTNVLTPWRISVRPGSMAVSAAEMSTDVAAAMSSVPEGVEVNEQCRAASRVEWETFPPEITRCER